MARPLFLLLFLTLLLFFPTDKAFAQQTHGQSSYFSVFRDVIIAFATIDEHKNNVLGTKMQQKVLPTITPMKQQTEITTYLLDKVNEYRTARGLSTVQTYPQVCAFAALRAQEITSNFSHKGFTKRVNERTLPYTTWSRATENIAEAPDYRQIVNLWANSPTHAANMRDHTPYVCIKQFGNYYAYEGMRM